MYSRRGGERRTLKAVFRIWTIFDRIRIRISKTYGPDPDPDLNKFLVKFLLVIFLGEICSKKYIHDPKTLET
jgi:hypothetical protein